MYNAPIQINQVECRDASRRCRDGARANRKVDRLATRFATDMNPSLAARRLR